MKVVVYGPDKRVGALVGDLVVDLNRAYARYLRAKGDPRPETSAAADVPSNLQGLIESGQRGLEGAQQALDSLGAGAGEDRELAQAGVVCKADAVKIHPPVPSEGSRIVCAGANFAKHSAGMRRMGGVDVTEQEIYDKARQDGQWGFWKISRPILGPDDALTYPSRTERLDYEGEIAIVLGKAGKDVAQSQLRDMVWGVTMLVDWSIRDDHGAVRVMSFNLGKNFDGSTSLGPCIVVGELDYEKLAVETKVNGEVRQQYNTSEMIYTFPEIVEFLSRDFTFLPGDVVSGGTGAGTAMDSSPRENGKPVADKFLKPGDTIEVTSPGIGVLRTKVTAPAAALAR